MDPDYSFFYSLFEERKLTVAALVNNGIALRRKTCHEHIFGPQERNGTTEEKSGLTVSCGGEKGIRGQSQT